MKVLITGGHGFVGTPAVAALRAQGHDVIAPHRGEYDLLAETDRKTLLHEHKPDALVHLAWQTTHGAFWTAPDNPQWRDASIDLMNRFFDTGGQRAVMAGSCAEYDWTTGAERLAEDAPCIPSTLYGTCKLETCEHALSMVSSGASIAWGRLFLLLGPRETPTRFIPSIIRPLLAGETAQMGSGSAVRDFMHTDDAGAAFAGLVDTPVTGAINIATGNGHRLRDVAALIKKQIGAGTLDVGALDDRPGDPEYLVADISRLQQELRFQSTQPLETAIADCVAYWQKQEKA